MTLNGQCDASCLVIKRCLNSLLDTLRVYLARGMYDSDYSIFDSS